MFPLEAKGSSDIISKGFKIEPNVSETQQWEPFHKSYKLDLEVRRGR